MESTRANGSRNNDGSHDSTSVVRLWLGLSSVLAAPAAARSLQTDESEVEPDPGHPRLRQRYQRNGSVPQRELQEQHKSSWPEVRSATEAARCSCYSHSIRAKVLS